MSEISFDEEGVFADAIASAQGPTDFGSSDFLPGLRALIETYDGSVWTEKGRKRNRKRLVGLLATRLKIEAGFTCHPEIRERPVPSPMVLTGLPRSGTSALFNLLGCDPAARPLLLWETQFPDPLEGFDPNGPDAGAPDPRHDMIEAYYAEARKKNPEFTKIHYASADTPEECVLIHAYALSGVQLGVEIMLEPYGSWLRSEDLRPLYSYYADLLRLLDWQRPGERWLLKAPAHMWGIDALIETFPDVSVVWSHRDPVACTASICSMTQSLFGPLAEVDPMWLGPVVMDWYATSLERGLAARDQNDPARFVDVAHDDFVADSLGVVERIYEHFGTAMPDEARTALTAHVDANPKGKHGKHEYDLGSFGLTIEDVRSRFAPYIDRFGVG
jgi:hypothetical protein